MLKMKNVMFVLGVCFVNLTMGQEVQGKAVYKSQRKMDFKIGSGQQATISEEQKAQIDARLMKQFQKTFVLNFDQNASIYKEEKSLTAPAGTPSNGLEVVVMGNGGGNDVLYKNMKEQRFVNKTEIMGKLFLIKDRLSAYDWQLTNETKSIGKYTCYKATYSREEEKVNMILENGEMTKKINKETIVTTAWYTSEVPVSTGPSYYHGLPGLVLEVIDGDVTIRCSEIILNPKEKVVINEPTKGKKVTQAAYREIMNKKTKEMMEKFKGRRDGERSIEIQVQG